MNKPKYGEKVSTGIPGLDELIEGGFTETAEGSSDLSGPGVEKFLATGIVSPTLESRGNELQKDRNTEDESGHAQLEGI
ncbi:MAG: hypothetical protein WED04_11170 [Promethearchaeati archaeon SRVP18_Atabeyarchaeia-1]